MAESKTNDALIITAPPRRYRSSVRGVLPESKAATPVPAAIREQGPQKKSDISGR